MNRCPRCGRRVMIKYMMRETGHIPDGVEDYLAVCEMCQIAWRECDWRLIWPHEGRVGPLYGVEAVVIAASSALDDGLAGAR